MTIPTISGAGIDGIARGLAARRSRRGALALLAAGIAAGGATAVRAADDCGCRDGEICIGGICSVIVEDSCDALGCRKGYRCEQGTCVKAPRKNKVRTGR